jgi:hypothetical protein
MALQVSLTIPPDRVPESPDEVAIPEVVYPEAYARIIYVRAMAQESFIFVCWYADQAARERGEQAVKVYEYQTDTTSLAGDVYPAAYAYLKTLPEFSGATDC